jgi:plastocyanin
VSNLRGLVIGCAFVLGVVAASPPRDAAASNRPTPEATPTEAAGVRGTNVTMDGVGFNPEVLIARVGETVTWTNKDPYPHNVVSSTGAFKSEDIAPDAQWRFHATKAGRFPYTCTLHPGMSGTLIVEP